MVDPRKQAVSLRLSTADLKKIKRMASRVGLRDSEIIRFAIKMLLIRLSPLSDPAIKGTSLVPLFLESGADLIRSFDLDAAKLDHIINEGTDDAQRVSAEDLHMIAMIGTEFSPYRSSALSPAHELLARQASSANPSHSGNGHESQERRRGSTIQRYLSDKYLERRHVTTEPASK